MFPVHRFIYFSSTIEISRHIETKEHFLDVQIWFKSSPRNLWNILWGWTFIVWRQSAWFIMLIAYCLSELQLFVWLMLLFRFESTKPDKTMQASQSICCSFTIRARFQFNFQEYIKRANWLKIFVYLRLKI